jgi:hypothetical protein
VHNDAPTKLEYTAGDYMGYNDLGYTLYAVYADDDTYTAFDNPTSKPHMIATEADAENLSAKGFVVLASDSFCMDWYPAIRGVGGVPSVALNENDDQHYLFVRAIDPSVTLRIGTLSSDGTVFSDDPDAYDANVNGYYNLGFIAVGNGIGVNVSAVLEHALSEFDAPQPGSESEYASSQSSGLGVNSVFAPGAGSAGIDNGVISGAIEHDRQNVLIRAIDTSGDGSVGINDAPVIEYANVATLSSQPSVVQDAFDRFNATGTIADNYDVASWDAILGSYLATWNAIYKANAYDYNSQRPTLQEIDALCATFKDGLESISPVHVHITQNGEQTQQPVVLNAFGQGIDACVSGYIGSIDTTRPLTLGTDTFSIEDADMGEADKAQARSYRIMAEGQQVGTITGTDHVSVNLCAPLADSLVSNESPVYKMTVPFVDNLTGQSDGSVPVTVQRDGNSVNADKTVAGQRNHTGNSSDAKSGASSAASGFLGSGNGLYDDTTAPRNDVARGAADAGGMSSLDAESSDTSQSQLAMIVFTITLLLFFAIATAGVVLMQRFRKKTQMASRWAKMFA